MAIFYCQMSVVSRSSGRSAVAAIAYRSGEKLTNERDGIAHDFERRYGVEHSEIILPDGVNAAWAMDRSSLWNAAERAEKRNDARVAREFVVALPHELSAEGRLDLTRAFAQDLANRYGAAVDFAIHAPHPDGDVRNHHAHVMMTTRQVGEEGLGAKTYMERANKELLPQGLPSTQMQLVDIRQSWEGMVNERLALEGHDIRIDHRSHAERGLEITPTEHMGVAATSMQRQGMTLDRARLNSDAAQRNANLIREKPEQVLSLITNEKSVFDRHDIARTLHRYISDDAQTYQNAFASVMASPALVELQGERVDSVTRDVSPARYSTREMIDLERGMMNSAERLAETRDHRVGRRHVIRAIARQDQAIRKSSGGASAAGNVLPGLSDEQRGAIEHVTGPERISAVVGFAGAGKSTMLAAAREAWEAQGYRVHGATLSGKAAEGLEEGSGIQSRTLASWSLGWQNEKHQLGRGDVFVLDEAGMVGSRQLAAFIGEAEVRGAKIVLVGDHEQLQAIGAGAPFRAIAEQIGHAELSEIRRQHVGWQRDASVLFATHRTAEGLAAYRDHGDIYFDETRDQARAQIVRDYIADREEHRDRTRIVMAHRRVDVRAINETIRSVLQERGELAKVEPTGELGDVRERERHKVFTYQTNDGKRDFAADDRLVFLENNRDLGVRNGMLGTVETVQPDVIQVRLDGNAASEPRLVNVPVHDYQAIDHGYAMTIHKNQGTTVDRAYVLASDTMDRHLTYVAMTRHRDSVQLYVARDEFTGRGGDPMPTGRLVEHGGAPFEHKVENRQSYFVTLENASGGRNTIWGVDLERAMKEAEPVIGAMIGLHHEGSQPVVLPDGTQTHRNAWRVQHAGELAYHRLEQRLSRSGAKETTLDYVRDFAERRGIAEVFGVTSEIEIPAEKLEPLVAAITHYDRSVEEVAREKAMAVIDQRFDIVESLVREVFRDPDEVAARLRAAITEKEGNGAIMAKAMAEQPERFGELRGKSGMLGDNKERKAVRHTATAVSAQIGYVSEAWERRLDEERKSEQWQRDKRDVVEVPGLRPRSVEILAEVAKTPVEKRSQLIDQLRSSPEGQLALEEARLVADALTQRFGHSDPRKFATELEKRPELVSQAEHIKTVARMVDYTHTTELVHDHTLKQQLSRSKGLRLDR